ncbi:MAG: Asp-tRNA(Asn)/Glu-tRNA(Gln) amidotransferase subunit GatC [Planctomycetota bacterium]
MALSDQQIDYVAHLARIALSEGERRRFGAQIASVLAYMDKLNELDTAEVPPTVCVMGLSNVFREDVAQPSTPRESITANAPAQAYGCYLVPRIID